MICKGIGVFLALTLLSAVAHAGSAPEELHGKSITVQWSESFSGKMETEQVARNFGIARRMNIYISTAGRPFLRITGAGMSGMPHSAQGNVVNAVSADSPPGQPDAKDRVNFEGRSIVVYREFAGGSAGARRIAVDLEGSSCKASVIVGKQAGKNLAYQTSGRGRIVMSSVQIGTVSCSIQDGNVFGQ
jgi:hypothetical protein